MADNFAIKHSLDSNGLQHYRFYAKSKKPVKDDIRHIPANAPAQDNLEALHALGFEVTSDGQMTARRPQPGGAVEDKILPLFVINLPRNSKSQDIFKPTALCNIIIKVEG